MMIPRLFSSIILHSIVSLTIINADNPSESDGSLHHRNTEFISGPQSRSPVRRDSIFTPLQQPKIVNGIPAVHEDFPYMVSLQGQSSGFFDFHFCGATIVRRAKPAVLLTAAHCLIVDDFGTVEASLEQRTGADWTMRATIGKDDVVESDGVSDRNFVDVDWWAFRAHGNYAVGSRFANDVGLVILKEGIPEKYGCNVTLETSTPCCIGGDSVTAVGYGRRDDNRPQTDTLESVELKYVSQSSCQRVFGSQLKDGMLCAFDSGEDSCQGDSGGPLLILPSGGAERQIGIVSWGAGCAESTPGVYADVGYYSDWIRTGSACMVVEYADMLAGNGSAILSEAELAPLRTECSQFCTTGDPDCAGPSTVAGKASPKFLCVYFLTLSLLFTLIFTF